MKRTPANQSKGGQRSNTALASENYVIPLPYSETIHAKDGDTIQWSWKHPFSVTVSNGVVNPSQVQATKNGDHYITSPLTVVGQPSTQGQCVYTSGPSGHDNKSAHLRGTVNPPPPPPPNQIIVDNA
jgi:hypothetical protein